MQVSSTVPYITLKDAVTQTLFTHTVESRVFQSSHHLGGCGYERLLVVRREQLHWPVPIKEYGYVCTGQLEAKMILGTYRCCEPCNRRPYLLPEAIFGSRYSASERWTVQLMLIWV